MVTRLRVRRGPNQRRDNTDDSRNLLVSHKRRPSHEGETTTTQSQGASPTAAGWTKAPGTDLISMTVPIGRFCRARLVVLFGNVNERFSAPLNPCATRKADSIGQNQLFA